MFAVFEPHIFHRYLIVLPHEQFCVPAYGCDHAIAYAMSHTHPQVYIAQ